MAGALQAQQPTLLAELTPEQAAVQRRVDADPVVQSSAGMLADVRSRRTQLERERVQLESEQQAMGSTLAGLERNIAVTSSNSKTLWAKVEALSDTLALEQRKEMVDKLRREHDDKLELAKSSDATFNDLRRKHHERQQTYDAVRERLDSLNVELARLVEQDATLAQLQSDRMQRLRDQFAECVFLVPSPTHSLTHSLTRSLTRSLSHSHRHGASDVSGLVRLAQRVHSALSETTVKRLSMDVSRERCRCPRLARLIL